VALTAPPTRLARRSPTWLAGAGVALAILAGLAAPVLGRRELLAVGLALPLLVACRTMVARPLGGVSLFIFATGTLMLFGARLFSASPDSGLLSRVSMPMEEFRRAQLLGNGLLSLFGTGAALGMLGFLRRTQRDALRVPPQQEYQPVRRSRETWLCLGITLVGVAGGLVGTGNASVLQLEPTSRPGQLLWQLATPVPGVLMLRRRKLLALAVVVPIALVPIVTGRRQGLLTPLAFLAFAWMATSIPRGKQLRPSMLVRAGVLIALLLAAVAALSATKRTATLSSVYPGEKVNVLSILAKDQVSADLFYLAVAREPRPAPVDLFGRIVALPVPRALWPSKPLSYDHEFRERYFPEFGGSMPISIVGTAYLALLAPGVVMAGILVGRLARLAAVLLERRTVRDVLIGSALLMLALDLVRVGGFYRELLTFVVSLAAIKLLVRDPA
jgi:hypothetical protein